MNKRELLLMECIADFLLLDIVGKLNSENIDGISIYSKIPSANNAFKKYLRYKKKYHAEDRLERMQKM